MNKTPLIVCATTIATLLAGTAQGQVLLSKVTDYRQNFDTLARTSGTNTTVRWTNNATLTGWYAASKASGDYTGYRVSGGEANNGWIYSFGTNGVNSITDRAFGSIASATPQAIAFGVRFKNDTPGTMTNIVVSYAGEQWRLSTSNGSDQALALRYKTDSAPITGPEPGETTGWTAVPALNFTRLKYGHDAGPLDGNEPSNRTVLSGVELAGASLKPGDELFLRWEDADDEKQSDHGLAIDDLSVSFVTLPPAE